MLTTPTHDGQISLAGFSSGRRHDFFYRTGLVLQVLGAALLAMLYLLESPFYTLGIMFFDVGVLLSAISLRVTLRPVKFFIVGSVMVGLALQLAGAFVVPEHRAGAIIIAGIGFICAGAAGMAGKEAFCFGYREGWLLAMIGFPGMVLANLLGNENHAFNTAGFCIIFLLLVSLTGKKLRQNLFATCSTTVRDKSGAGQQ
jgi:uncharacterized integral membrane protein